MTREKALVFLSEVEKERLLLKQSVGIIEKRLLALKKKSKKKTGLSI